MSTSLQRIREKYANQLAEIEAWEDVAPFTVVG
jgi:hypothetical protein